MDTINAIEDCFRSLITAIATTTSAGRIRMHIVSSFAEFEQSMIPERTKAGLKEARLHGRVSNRRAKLTQ